MDFCNFCHQPCGPMGFCDEGCYQEYEDEMRCFVEDIEKDQDYID